MQPDLPTSDPNDLNSVQGPTLHRPDGEEQQNSTPTTADASQGGTSDQGKAGSGHAKIDAGSPKPAATTADLLQISEITRNRLAQMARRPVSDCRESFLFDEDFFCGLKYRLDVFSSVWMADEDVVRFYRNQQPIGVIELAPSQADAA